MKKLIVFLSILLMSSIAWSATVTGKLSSVEVSYEHASFTYRYYVTLEGSSMKYFLEVKDGRSQAVVDAQYSLLVTAYALGHTVTMETDYQGTTDARIRDLKISE